MVVRTLKRGFMWKERVLRAEEVVMQKWKEGFSCAARRLRKSDRQLTRHAKCNRIKPPRIFAHP